MASFDQRMFALTSGLDPARHADELARLRRCRSVADLEALARDGWVVPRAQEPRIRLVRHGSGTFLLVEYNDGWTKTISQG